MDKTHEDLSPAPDQTQNQQIAFKNGGNDFQISVSEFNELFADIGKHNRKFSVAAMMVQGIKSAIKDEEDAGQGNFLDSFSEDQQHMSASGVSFVNENTFKKLGLSLEPVAHTTTVYMDGQKASEGEVRLNVADRKQFLAFLSGLNQEVVGDPEFRGGLTSLAEGLSKQLSGHYNLDEPSDEMLELFGGMDEIIKQYKRLGLEDAVGNLETYLKHALNGSLKEYLEIERHQFLGEPGKSFGPADWQKDGGIPLVMKGYNQAIDILNRLKGNPKSQELYGQLRDHLSHCIQVARGDLDEITYIKDNPDLKVAFGQVYDQIEARLKEVTSR